MTYDAQKIFGIPYGDAIVESAIALNKKQMYSTADRGAFPKTSLRLLEGAGEPEICLAKLTDNFENLRGIFAKRDREYARRKLPKANSYSACSSRTVFRHAAARHMG